tara:strand:- start:2117 stop:2380 length:264 start_codon:yes stop_codon:yes gene_type:complete
MKELNEKLLTLVVKQKDPALIKHVDRMIKTDEKVKVCHVPYHAVERARVLYKTKPFKMVIKTLNSEGYYMSESTLWGWLKLTRRVKR